MWAGAVFVQAARQRKGVQQGIETGKSSLGTKKRVLRGTSRYGDDNVTEWAMKNFERKRDDDKTKKRGRQSRRKGRIKRGQRGSREE